MRQIPDKVSIIRTVNIPQDKTLSEMMHLLRQILEDDQNRASLLHEYHKTIWYSLHIELSEEALTILSDLENDTYNYWAFYESPIPEIRMISDEELESLVKEAIRKIEELGYSEGD